MPLRIIRLLDSIRTRCWPLAVAAAVCTGSLALAQSSRPTGSLTTRPAEQVQAEFDKALLAYLQRPEDRWIVSFPINFKQEFASPSEEYSPATCSNICGQIPRSCVPPSSASPRAARTSGR